MKKHLYILKYILLSSVIAAVSLAAGKKATIINGYANSADNVIILKIAALSGDNQVPAVKTAAAGSVAASYNMATKVLSFTIKYTGLTPTMAHIHAGYNGTNGPVVVPLNIPLGSPIYGSVTLTNAQEQDLLAGKYYVNIHTAENPSGELRAQLTPPNILLFSNIASGDTQVPAVSTNATSTFYGTYNTASKILNYAISYLGTPPTMAHLHNGAAGTNGPVEFMLTTPVSGLTVTGTTAAFTPTEEADLEAGKLYYNVHTATNKNGELRAQLTSNYSINY